MSTDVRTFLVRAIVLLVSVALSANSVSLAAIARGYRMFDQSGAPARVVINLTEPLAAGNQVLEGLPSDVMVTAAVALRVMDMGGDPVFDEVPLGLLPPTPDGNQLVQSFELEGLIGIVYDISRPLLNTETVDGEVVGSNPGLIDGVGSPDDDFGMQQDGLDDLVLGNIELCSAIGLTDITTHADPPHVIGLSNTVLGSTFGQARLDGAGSSQVNPALNLTNLSYTVNGPGIKRGDYEIESQFTINSGLPRNAGKEVATTLTITGGTPGPNPFGYEGEMTSESMRLISWLPQFKSWANLKHSIDVEFREVGGGLLLPRPQDSTALTTNTSQADCNCDNAEPEGSYTEVFDLNLFEGVTYGAGIRACSAGVVYAAGTTQYSYRGAASVGVAACPVPDSCIAPAFNVSNADGKSIRFEQVDIAFDHMDLEMTSVSVDDSTPLEGTIVNITAVITNIGTRDGEMISVTVRDAGLLVRPPQIVDLLPAGNSATVTIPWDTSCGFWINPHSLVVDVESLTIMEPDYSTNTQSVPVTVQPSVQAAFISAGQGIGAGDVYVLRTRAQNFSNTLIGRLDIPAQTTVLDPAPQGVAVARDGQSARVALTTDDSILGIDLPTCYTGVCQPILPTRPLTDAQPLDTIGSIGVNAAGTRAFVPYNRGTEGKVAIFDITSGATSAPSNLSVTGGNQAEFDIDSESAVALQYNFNQTSLDSTEEAYFAAQPTFGLPTGTARMYWLDANAVSPVVSNYDFTLTNAFPFSAHPAGVAFSAEGHAVFANSGSGSMFTVNPVYRTLEGGAQVPEGNIAKWPTDIVADRAGIESYSIFTVLLPDFFYAYDYKTPSAGKRTFFPPHDIFNDLAMDNTCAGGLPGPGTESIWIADGGSPISGGGHIDIFTRQGLYRGGFFMAALPPFATRNPTSITIAPLPTNGTIGVAPPPIPDPEIPPPTWPPNTDPDYDLVTLDPDTLNAVVAIPVLNMLDSPLSFDLQFQDVPPGWMVNPLDLSELDPVPPFEFDLANLRFAQVEIVAPEPFLGSVAFPVVPTAPDPTEFAPILLHVEVDLAPQEQIGLLIDQVDELVSTMVLTPQQGSDLVASLEAALDFLMQSDLAGVTDELRTFNAEVAALMDTDDIPAQTGATLITHSNDLILDIGASCTEDLDLDGFLGVCSDCDDSNPDVWKAPSEVQDVLASHDAVTGVTTISWSPPASLGGTAPVVYDVIRSDQSNDFLGGVCVESDDSDTEALDTEPPLTGEVFHYLIRAENPCPGISGQGSVGTDSNEIPRSAPACDSSSGS